MCIKHKNLYLTMNCILNICFPIWGKKLTHYKIYSKTFQKLSISKRNFFYINSSLNLKNTEFFKHKKCISETWVTRKRLLYNFFFFFVILYLEIDQKFGYIFIFSPESDFAENSFSEKTEHEIEHNRKKYMLHCYIQKSGSYENNVNQNIMTNCSSLNSIKKNYSECI